MGAFCTLGNLQPVGDLLGVLITYDGGEDLLFALGERLVAMGGAMSAAHTLIAPVLARRR